MKIIECIPNFSEGRSEDFINKVATALSGIDGIKVLDFSMDHDHNRSVFTFIGTPESIQHGANTACDIALEYIDMKQHSGIHPRIGAVDVVPFVPLKGATMTDAVKAAHKFGRAFGKRNKIPIYFYGEAALYPERKRLFMVRKGQYEGLIEKIKDPLWMPDAGPSAFNAAKGATAVGARKPLIAFNINLDTNNLAIGKTIAKEIRYSSGGYQHVQAIGLFLKSRNIVQISMNLTDYEITSLKKVFDSVKEKAEAYGIDILESELIGLIPQAALIDITPQQLKLSGFSEEKIIETHLNT